MLKKTSTFTFAFILGLIIFLPSFFVLPKLSSAATVYHTLTIYRLTFTGNLNGGGFITSSDNGIDNAINCQSSTTGCSVQVADGSSFGLTLVPDTGSTGKFYTGALDGCYGFQLGNTICDVELMSADISLTYGFQKNTTPTITTSSLTATTVTLNATGLTPNTQNVVFTLAATTGGTLPTPSYNKSTTVVSSASGIAGASFTGLSPGGSYSGTVTSSVDPLVTVDFVSPATTTVPTITTISPMTGKVGDTITITGTNLTGVSWVFFGTDSNITITNTPTEITVRVPPDATNGKITVHTANGDAISSNNFTVTTTTNPSTCSNGATDPPTCTPPVGGGGGDINTGETGFSGLVPKCNTGEIDPVTKNYKNPCNFNSLMDGINKFINFVLITLATPLFALILIYVGWLYLSAGGSSENVTKAKKILKNALFGYIIALAAWLIVKTILTALGFTGPMFLG